MKLIIQIYLSMKIQHLNAPLIIFFALLFSNCNEKNESSDGPNQFEHVSSTDRYFDFKRIMSLEANEGTVVSTATSGSLDAYDTYVLPFLNESGLDSTKRFAVSYTFPLHGDSLTLGTMSNYLDSEPSYSEIRVYNSFIGVTTKKCYDIHLKYKSGNQTLLIPGSSIKWMNDICVTECKKARPTTAGAVVPIGNFLPNRTIEEFRSGIKTLYRHSMPYKTNGLDSFKSFVVKKSEYNQIISEPDAVAVRVYHGWDKEISERVIVIVGVDAQGYSLWNRKVIRGDKSHLCPEECDLF